MKYLKSFNKIFETQQQFNKTIKDRNITKNSFISNIESSLVSNGLSSYLGYISNLIDEKFSMTCNNNIQQRLNDLVDSLKFIKVNGININSIKAYDISIINSTSVNISNGTSLDIIDILFIIYQVLLIFYLLYQQLNLHNCR